MILFYHIQCHLALQGSRILILRFRTGSLRRTLSPRFESYANQYRKSKTLQRCWHGRVVNLSASEFSASCLIILCGIADHRINKHFKDFFSLSLYNFFTQLKELRSFGILVFIAMSCTCLRVRVIHVETSCLEH